jgi:hypothetical protein
MEPKMPEHDSPLIEGSVTSPASSEALQTAKRVAKHFGAQLAVSNEPSYPLLLTMLGNVERRRAILIGHPCPTCGAAEGANHTVECPETYERPSVPPRHIVFPNVCGRCGRLWPQLFRVSDQEWRYYIPPDKQTLILCLDCYQHIRAAIDEQEGIAPKQPLEGIEML